MLMWIKDNPLNNHHIIYKLYDFCGLCTRRDKDINLEVNKMQENEINNKQKCLMKLILIEDQAIIDCVFIM